MASSGCLIWASCVFHVAPRAGCAWAGTRSRIERRGGLVEVLLTARDPLFEQRHAGGFFLEDVLIGQDPNQLGVASHARQQLRPHHPLVHDCLGLGANDTDPMHREQESDTANSRAISANGANTRRRRRMTEASVPVTRGSLTGARPRPYGRRTLFIGRCSSAGREFAPPASSAYLAPAGILHESRELCDGPIPVWLLCTERTRQIVRSAHWCQVVRGTAPRFAVGLACTSAVLLAAPRYATAGGGPATDAYDAIAARRIVDVHLLLDAYVLYNFNDPTTGVNQLRMFDILCQSAVAELLAAHSRAPPVAVRVPRRRRGRRRSAGVFSLGSGSFPRIPSLLRCFPYVQQAFATVVIPARHGIAIDAGKFDSPSGFEDNVTPGNWNYSRGLLYSWAEPTLRHRRARVDARDRHCRCVRVLGQRLEHESRGRRRHALVRARPGVEAFLVDALEITAVDMAGLERAPEDPAGPTLSFRNLFNAYADL